MPDEASPTAAPNAGLDDLERRLASFEHATRRLGRTVSDIAEPVTTGHSSPPRPATRRLSESGVPRSDEISGLRPAVASQGPQTGALTARSRSGAEAAAPGFTSKFGKPAIPHSPPISAPPLDAHATRPRRRARLFVLAAVAICVSLLLLQLPRLYPVLVEAAVWAEEVQVPATDGGLVDAVPVRVGESVRTGQTLVGIGKQSVTCPIDGVVIRLFASPGNRLATGEPVALLAMPQTARVVAALPNDRSASVGDRVRIELLGERRFMGGSVQAVLNAGQPGPWSGANSPPRRIVIVPDPSMSPLQLAQGCKVSLVGPTSGVNDLLFALRQTIPW